MTPPEWLSDDFRDELYEILSLCESAEETRELVHLLLAESEIEDVACRLRAAILRSEGWSGVKINDFYRNSEVTISRAVISRVNKEIVGSNGQLPFKAYYQRLKDRLYRK